MTYSIDIINLSIYHYNLGLKKIQICKSLNITNKMSKIKNKVFYFTPTLSKKSKDFLDNEHFIFGIINIIIIILIISN
jgi:hypothetical protein